MAGPLVAPGRLSAALVAAAYLVFTAFVARVLTRGGVLGSCGCFGKPDTPATRTHLALTGVAALTALAVAIDPPAGVWSDVDTAEPHHRRTGRGHRVPGLAGDGRPADHVPRRHPQQRRADPPEPRRERTDLMLAVVIAEGVAVVLLGVLVLGLLRSHALILKALHELGAGLELEKEAGTGSHHGDHRRQARTGARRARDGRRAGDPQGLAPRPTTSSAPTSTGTSSGSA